MRERPILFNGDMVRAILEGRKTQTRRMVSNKRYLDCDIIQDTDIINGKEVSLGFECANGDWHTTESMCPFGQVGERMWVRETVADIGPRLTYKADENDGAHCQVKRWTPSIHMPRWASRILLEITAVRVERLQDISKEDAAEEGFDLPATEGQSWKLGARHNFRHTWDSIYENWDANPWVWVVEFKVVTE